MAPPNPAKADFSNPAGEVVPPKALPLPKALPVPNALAPNPPAFGLSPPPTVFGVCPKAEAPKPKPVELGTFAVPKAPKPREVDGEDDDPKAEEPNAELVGAEGLEG